MLHLSQILLRTHWYFLSCGPIDRGMDIEGLVRSSHGSQINDLSAYASFHLKSCRRYRSQTGLPMRYTLLSCSYSGDQLIHQLIYLVGCQTLASTQRSLRDLC